MPYHRFTLQKYVYGCKLECPQCHHPRCFKLYIDQEGKITFPAYVGICDRKDKCGYHYPPKQWFKGTGQKFEDESSTYTPRPFIPPKPTSYIDRSVMEESLDNYQANPFYHFLVYAFGDDEALRLCRMYNVGTYNKWQGATIFWQVDSLGRVRTGKIMGYHPRTGHRIKEPFPQFTWAHAELKLSDFNLRQCLFGEHLLSERSDATVMIVESEKSAIIASHFMPNFVWLATGGISNLQPSRCQCLAGRDVLLLPDLKAEDKWKAKLPALAEICRTVAVTDFLTKNATDEQREEGADIADFLLSTKTDYMVLHEMFDKNPEVKKLYHGLDCQLVEMRNIRGP